MNKLIYCGHSTIIIETSKGKRIIIDPFLEGNPLCPENLKDPGPIDYICLTHGHQDHTSSAVNLALSTGAIVFATFELANLIIADGVPANQVQFMNKGGYVNAPNSENIFIHLTNAFHSSSYIDKQGICHYAGEACGVVINLECGASIYHAGDTSLFSDMKLIGERFSPDIALLPIGDRFTMDPKDAANAATLIGAKLTIPIHWGTFDLLNGTPEEFKKYATVNVEKLEAGESREF